MGIHYNLGHGVLDFIKNPEVYSFVDEYMKYPSEPGQGVEMNKELIIEENEHPHE